MGNTCYPDPSSSHQQPNNIVAFSKIITPSTPSTTKTYSYGVNQQQNEQRESKEFKEEEDINSFDYANVILKDHTNTDAFQGIDKSDDGWFDDQWHHLADDLIYRGEWKDGLPHGHGMVYFRDLQMIACLNFKQGYIEGQKCQTLQKNRQAQMVGITHNVQDVDESDYIYRIQVCLEKFRSKQQNNQNYDEQNQY